MTFVLQRGARERKLASVKRKLEAILTAIESGIYTFSTKERLEVLEVEQVELEKAEAIEAMPTIYPNLAQPYRDKVARLEEELAQPELAADAKSVIRSMIKTIIVTPREKRGEVGNDAGARRRGATTH